MGTEFHSKPALARFCVHRHPGEGYCVVDPEGQRVSGYTQSKTQAEQWCDQKQAARDAAMKRKTRPCLRCGTEFLSEGIHNRMCNRCRHCASNDEAAPFSFGTIHGRKRA